jgi:uncharacterized protein (TIGR03086 family)
MALSDLTPAERHRRISGDFTALVRRVVDWGAPAPVAGWAAEDVVEHLVTWLPGFLSAGGVALPASPAATPAEAWTAHAAAVQALLDDPEQATADFAHEQVGRMPVADAIDRFYTADVFLHSWDLARASGQDVALDPELCAALLAGMEPMDDVLRASGQYGPRVEVPEDADVQTRLVAFIGRDPAWRPAPVA